jgi:hypothetical protein
MSWVETSLVEIIRTTWITPAIELIAPFHSISLVRSETMRVSNLPLLVEEFIQPGFRLSNSTADQVA